MARLVRGRYEPLRVVARGAQGEIVEALDHLHGRRVALKVRRVHKPGREALLGEARVLLNVTPHAGITLVRDDFFVRDRYYLVMDWVEGPNLHTLLARRGSPGLPLREVRQYVRQVADALDHLHSHDPPIVHGDVKPSNVILTAGRGAVLVDFGLSAEQGLAGEPATGTRGYLAPELIDGAPACPSTDVYALAATAFTLLAGAPPQPGTPLPVAELGSADARLVGDSLAAGLAMDAARRPSSAHDFAEALAGGSPGPLPSGTVTFLFTDIEGSTELVRALGERYVELLESCRGILRSAVTEHGGREFGTEGDALFAVFERPAEAVEAASSAQLALGAHPWPDGAEVRVRMGVHTGDAYLSAGDYVGLAVHYAARVASAAHGGQILLSGATRALVAPALSGNVSLTDLGSYRLKGIDEPAQLFQLAHPGLGAEFPAPGANPVRTDNLPAEVSSFLGRDRELSEILGRLLSERMLTLTGAGGCGKTRLAIRAASLSKAGYPGGVWWVELGEVSQGALVPHVVAATLGLRAEPGRALEDALIEHLGAGRTLIVLDNCEHLAEACARLSATLLARCPEALILATSREPLHVPGETLYAVAPLALPSPRDTDVSRLRASGAVALFVERAAGHRQGFRLTPGNAAAVADVCRRLDGIPLAIELAAARVRVMSPEELAVKLDDRFRLLTTGARTGAPRQQTLRAAIDWSYDLLAGDEAALFERLSVFAGGFSLDAAEFVCGADDPEALSVLDGVARLVDRSLVGAADRGGGTRYSMLETIREYARERLHASGADERIRSRHARWSSALAGRAEPELRGPDQAAWHELLEREHPNLLSALDWCLGRDAEYALLMATAIAQFWSVRGYWAEGRRRLEAALETGAGTPSARARAHLAAGALAESGGDYPGATAHHEESLRLSRSASDDHGVGSALNQLGELARLRGDYDVARERYLEALAIMRRLEEKRGMAQVLTNQGALALQTGDAEAARALYEEALAMMQELGEARGTAKLLNMLGMVAYSRPEGKTARELVERSLAAFRGLGDHADTAEALQNLGLISAGEDDPQAATALWEESLAIFRELGNKRGVANLLYNLGRLAEEGNDISRAYACYEECRTVAGRLGEERRTAATLFWMLAEAGERLGHDQLAGECLGGYVVLQGELGETASVARGLEAQAAAVGRAGDDDRSGALYREALDIYAELGDEEGIGRCVAGMARAAAGRDRLVDAARLYGAASRVAPSLEPIIGKAAASVRAALGQRPFEEAWTQGHTAGVEEVLA